jgi:hypothetical protein
MHRPTNRKRKCYVHHPEEREVVLKPLVR